MSNCTIHGLKVDSGRPYDLSIITVCRNAHDALHLTLQSVLWQKQHGSLQIEHIVVDGASTDGSAELALAAKERGDIEQCVSEPDQGIYDAMNKGIRMAHGKVLHFLNCGDTFCKVNLSRFVEPILNGRTVAVAAGVYFIQESELHHIISLYRESGDYHPGEFSCACFGHRFLGAMAYHPGYFAAAHLFAEFGGFDTVFSCIADAYFINLVSRKYGDPMAFHEPVAYFVRGGYSTDARRRFWPEYVEMSERFWPDITRLCRGNRDYLYFSIGFIAGTAVYASPQAPPHWRGRADIVEVLKKQCRELRELAPGMRRKCALWLLEKMVDHIESSGRNARWRGYTWLLTLPPREMTCSRYFPETTIWDLVKAKIKSIFKRKSI